jgi:ribose transport system substrate-binding protein
MLRTLTALLLLLVSVSIHAKECISLVTAGDDRHPFWTELIRGAISASDELHIDLYYRGVADEERQKLIIDYMLKTYHCPGIVLAPAGGSLRQTVEELNQTGITVTYIDRDVGGNRAAVIKSDNFYAGTLAAQLMKQQLQGRKHIALLRVKKGVASTDAREAGFIQEAQRLGMNIVINQYLGLSMSEGRSQALEIFSTNPDIDGIFTPTATTTEVVQRVLENRTLPTKPVHIGFDGSDYLDKKVRQKQLFGYIKQDPFNIGYYGVYSTYNQLHNKPYEKNMGISVFFVSEVSLGKP